MTKRAVETVHLPSHPDRSRKARPIRAAGGHRLYVHDEPSKCPNHRYCAYDGTERDRCSECHSTLKVGCEHQEHGGMPGGNRACLCRVCGEIFSSNSAFDHCHRLSNMHADPGDRGLVLVQRGEWMLWAFPGEPPAR